MKNLFLSFKETMLQGAASENGSKKMQVNHRITPVRFAFALLMLLTFGVGNARGAENDTHDFAQDDELHGLNKCATFDDIDISAQSYPVKQVIITYAYNKSNSPSFTVTVGDDDWGTNTIAGTGSTTTYETLSFSGDAVIGAVNIHFNTGSSCSGTGRGSIRISNVRLVEGSSGAGGCTAGVASSIKAGDVVLMYYSTYELSGITSNNGSYWGDYTTCGATPSGAYPLTVEAGSSSGTWSFKNGDNYLAVTSDANMLTTSTTKNANSSWTVSISSGNATITNSAYTSRIIKFNSSTDRFSTYTGTPSSTYLVKLYKYCNDVTYRVTYYGNENTGGSVPTDNNEYTSAQSATVLGNTGSLEKTGYAWAGWNTQADGNGTTYTAGNSISMSGGSISLYAKWIPTYTVTWISNGSTIQTDSNVGSGTALTPPTISPLPCGDKLAGWTDAADGAYVHGTSTLYTSATITISANKTFYAVFADYDE